MLTDSLTESFLIHSWDAMDAPQTNKDVQKLTGCMAALNRFIS
jgi:hypothetical protein